MLSLYNIQSEKILKKEECVVHNRDNIMRVFKASCHRETSDKKDLLFRVILLVHYHAEFSVEY